MSEVAKLDRGDGLETMLGDDFFCCCTRGGFVGLFGWTWSTFSDGISYCIVHVHVKQCDYKFIDEFYMTEIKIIFNNK